MSGNVQRPGGWVDGIGWVALLHDVIGLNAWTADDADEAKGSPEGWVSYGPATVDYNRPVIVMQWADGTSPVPSVDDERPDTGLLRALAQAAMARLAEPCSGCDDTGWSVDENWSPEYGEDRSEGAGLTPCGFCNEGDWSKYRDEFTPDKSWPGPRSWRSSEFIAACSPATILALLDAHPPVRVQPQPDELRALRKLSDAATPGEWTADSGSVIVIATGDERPFGVVGQWVGTATWNAAFIAAAANYVRSLLAASPATEAPPAVPATGQDGDGWYCESVAVGMESVAGVCTADNPIHSAPCGPLAARPSGGTA